MKGTKIMVRRFLLGCVTVSALSVNACITYPGPSGTIIACGDEHPTLRVNGQATYVCQDTGVDNKYWNFFRR
jgi:hypothetical protein